MDVQTHFTQNFSCAKCRGKSASLRETRLPATGLIQLVSEGGLSVKYYAVTCTLCGFTELFDSRVFAFQPEAAETESTVPNKY